MQSLTKSSLLSLKQQRRPAMFVPLLLLWHYHTFFHVGKEIPWRPDNKGLNFQGTVSVSPLDLFDTLFHQTCIH